MKRLVLGMLCLALLALPLLGVDLGLVDIAVLDSVDVNGVTIHLDDTVTVVGVITATELGNPLFIQDATGGVAIYDWGVVDSAYSVGDTIFLRGTVGQYNGLTEIISVDSCGFIARGALPDTLVYPDFSAMLDSSYAESLEGMLIRVDSVFVVDTTTWPGAGSSGNVTLQDMAGNTFTIRIDSDTDIDGSPCPTDTFALIGVMGQYDSSSPYWSGYQIYPRSLNDIYHYGGDAVAPEVSAAWYWDIQLVFVKFSEPVDTATATDAGNYSFDDSSITVDSVVMQDVDLVALYTAADLLGNLYVVSVVDVQDTAGNPIVVPSTAEFYGSIMDIAVAKEDADSDFVPDKYGYVVTCEGVITAPWGILGYNSWWMQDASAGIQVYGVSSDPGYLEGDRVRVAGFVAQYRGGEELSGVLMHEFIDTDVVPDPMVVTPADFADVVGEAYNGLLVKVENLVPVDTTQVFPSDGSSGAFYVMEDGNPADSIKMWIYSGTNIDGWDGPAQWPCNITGIFGQYTYSDPPNDGYQLYPRDTTDFEPYVGILVSDFEPRVFRLVSKGPNPAMDVFSVAFEVPARTGVEFSVFDASGRLVDRIDMGKLVPGVHTVNWNTKDVASGVYFYRVTAGVEEITGKVVVLK